MVKECALSTGNLPWGGLLRNIVDRITDRPDMTSAVDHGCKASAQPKRTLLKPFIHGHVCVYANFAYICAKFLYVSKSIFTSHSHGFFGSVEAVQN